MYTSSLINNMKKSGAKPPSKKGKFKRKLGDNDFTDNTKLSFKELTEEELAEVKKNIRLKYEKEKRKEKIILLIIGIILISTTLLLLY